MFQGERTLSRGVCRFFFQLCIKIGGALVSLFAILYVFRQFSLVCTYMCYCRSEHNFSVCVCHHKKGGDCWLY